MSPLSTKPSTSVRMVSPSSGLAAGEDDDSCARCDRSQHRQHVASGQIGQSEVEHHDIGLHPRSLPRPRCARRRPPRRPRNRRAPAGPAARAGAIRRHHRPGALRLPPPPPLFTVPVRASWVVDRPGWERQTRAVTQTGPRAGGGPGQLSGLRVLDLSVWRPGPYATQLLAELGADVLKVEPPGGDPMRAYPELFASLHANKRSIVLDLKDGDGSTAGARARRRSGRLPRGFPPRGRRLGSAWATTTCAPSRRRSSTAPCPAWDRPVPAGSYRVTTSTTRPGRACSLLTGASPIVANLPVADLAGGLAAAFAVCACGDPSSSGRVKASTSTPR